MLGTPDGVTCLVALVAATATFLWGRIMINGALRRLSAAPLNSDGTATALLEATARAGDTG